MKHIYSILVCFTALSFVYLHAKTTLLSDNGIWLNPDGGEWFTIDSLDHPKPHLFSDCDCSDSLDCVAVAIGPVYTQRALIRRTSDGGKTWMTIRRDSIHLEPDGTGDSIVVNFAPYFMIAHPTREIVVALCDSGAVIRSTDGGNTWNKQYLPLTLKSARARQLYMKGRVGIARYEEGVGFIYISEDYGATWKKKEVKVPITFNAMNTICLIDTNAFFVSVTRKYVTDPALNTSHYISFDRGETWNYVFSNPRSLYFWNFVFVSRTIGWALSTSGLYKTLNGGVTWSKNHDDNNFLSLKFADKNHGALLLDTTMFLTSDGGEHWMEKGFRSIGGTPYPDGYHSVSFMGAEHPIIFSNRRGFRYSASVVSNTETEEFDRDAALHAYTNQDATLLRVSATDEITSPLHYVIANAYGEIVQQGDVAPNFGEKTLHIDIQNLGSGAYYCLFGNGTTCRRAGFIITR